MKTNISNALMDEILVLNPLHKNFLDNAYSKLTESDKQSMETYLRFLIEVEKLEVKFIATAYDLIVKDTLREQMYFMRHKKYRYSTYDEVKGSVYLNDEYMTKYMFGLAITSFLWPQHQAIHKWFEKNMPLNKPGKYLEIGPGHGYYFMESLRKCAFDYYLGVDISPSSIRLTKSIISSGFFGNFDRYELLLTDFLAEGLNDKFDAVVMGEVLEHVENPAAFIAKIKQVSKPDAFIYITTVINAAAIDHIALFSNVDDLEKCINEGGLKVKDYLLTSSNPEMSTDEVIKAKLPANIALVLQH